MKIIYFLFFCFIAFSCKKSNNYEHDCMSEKPIRFSSKSLYLQNHNSNVSDWYSDDKKYVIHHYGESSEVVYDNISKSILFKAAQGFNLKDKIVFKKNEFSLYVELSVTKLRSLVNDLPITSPISLFENDSSNSYIFNGEINVTGESQILTKPYNNIGGILYHNFPISQMDSSFNVFTITTNSKEFNVYKNSIKIYRWIFLEKVNENSSLEIKKIIGNMGFRGRIKNILIFNSFHEDNIVSKYTIQIKK